MKTILKIARTELQTIFYSPIAWLILIVFTIQSCMAFCNAMEWQVSAQSLAYKLESVSLTLFADHHRGIFMIVQNYLYLYIPLLTMGLMSREYGSGSIKLLYSSPVTNSQIILGKYLSMVVYSLALTAVLFLFTLYSCFTVDHFDMMAVCAGLLGMFLLMCAYSAIGLFMSSLTSYQVVAAIGTLATLAVLGFVGDLWQDVAFVRDISYWLSIKGRSTEFILGLVCSEDVIYFLTVIALFLSLSIIRLKANRQKTPFRSVFAKYIAVFAGAFLIGYVSSRPAIMCYFDATRTKQNTLTPNSQKIVAQLKGGLTINTYNNILDKYYYLAMPKGQLTDIERFRQYTRFKPEIKMNYIMYYDHADNPRLDKRYPGKSDKQRMEEYCKVFRLDSSLFKSPEEIKKIENLAPENNRFVRTLVRDNGEKTFLRVFDDMKVTPSEAEITAAFKRLVMELPQIGFVTGHGERSCIKYADRDYSIFAQERTFRYSLINQGFDYTEVNLDKEVPSTVDILVISDMQSALTPEQKANLDKYIAKGGNLLIAGEPGDQERMNPIVADFGVQFMPGRLFKPSKNFSPDFITAVPTKEGSDLMYLVNDMRTERYVNTMPGTTGLSYTEDKGFKVTKLFVSDTTGGTWNELGAVKPVYDSTESVKPAAGVDTTTSFPTIVALSRKIADKEQKIIVMGDADCLSNIEISMVRKGVEAANYNFIMGSFFWMSNDEVPIDVRRPTPPDAKIYMGMSGIRTTKWLFMGLLPLGMLVFYLFMWVRRKGR